MHVAPRLTITLPTYNRAGFLERSLAEHRYITNAEDASFIILDNASTDATAEVVDRSLMKSEFVRYFRNEQTIPHEQNFEKALKYGESDYIWLLGDTYLIPETSFKAVLSAIGEDDYDLVLLNVAGRVTDVAERVYSDRSELLADLGWHMTCISVLVYNKRLLQEANFTRYHDTNFLQTGIIFEFLSDRPFKVKWLPCHSVQGLKVTGLSKTSWEDVTFEIWTKRWANFVFSLPSSYSLDSKLKCAMDHGIKSGVLTLKALARLRKKKNFNRDVYHRYAHFFPFTIKYPASLLRLIAILPSWLFRVI
jgi:glycosyltransferase involved in cell wall biosynthesis